MARSGYAIGNRISAKSTNRGGRSNFRSHVPIFCGVIAIIGLIGCILIWSLNNHETDQVETEESIQRKNSAAAPKASRAKGKPIPISKIEPDKTKGVAKPELFDENPLVRQKALGRIVKWEHRQGPPLFTNRFEALVCEIMTAEPGERFLELDIEEDFDNTFNESLKNTIKIASDDPDDVKFMKQTVIDAKEEMRRLALQGASARDVIIEARDELNKIADYRDELQNAVNEYLVTATDPNDALKLVREANEILAEYGAMPVDGPDDEETAYELMLNAKEERIAELDADTSENNEED